LFITALFNLICPRKVVRSKKKKDLSGKLLLAPSTKTANLRWIKYYTPEPVFFRLLLCKEINKTNDPKSCPCPEYKNTWANDILCKLGKKFAHLYFRYEQPKKVHKDARSCIVIFAKNNLKTDEIEQRLKNTVNYLGVQKENLDFHVIPFSFEKTSVVFGYRSKLKRNLKKCYASSNVDVKRNIEMKENDELMVLEINNNNANKEFSIGTIVEDRAS